MPSNQEQIWIKMWKDNSAELREKAVLWRKQNAMIRIAKPSRISRARRLGYKAKQGYIIVRYRIGKGSSKRETPSGGRKPVRVGKMKITPGKSLKRIAEERASKKYPNMEILNSYYVGETGKYKWYEVILVDRAHPVIKSDKKISWITNKRGRAYRGLTSAGKKGRGLIK